MKVCFAWCRIALLAIFALSFNLALAQTNSGEISGRVVDPADAVVVDAEVTLTNQATSENRVVKTDKEGGFRFVALQPGAYSISVAAPGFKISKKTGLQLSSSERLSAGAINLNVGATTETLSVTAEAAPIQTESSERSALLDSKEVSSLMSVGRDPMALMRTMPGVVQDGGGAGSLGQTSAGTVSGVRGDNNAISVDGVTGNTRGGANLDSNVNMDAVAEVKVLLNNYQAEYGQSSGAIINMVTKSGGQTFHGSGYYYGRNEFFNANTWLNNYGTTKNGVWTPTERGKSRYNTVGFTLGGPAYIPGKFNRNKDKLFFFYSREMWPTKSTPNTTTKFRMPTALERQGDFSQSYDKNNKPVVVLDPLTGAPFAGNKIPTDRINKDMQKLMNIFPLPQINCTSDCPVYSSATYNYQVLPVTDAPTNQDLLRLDYNLNSKLHMYFRGYLTSQERNGLGATTNKLNWGIPGYYNTPGQNAAYNVTYIASPTLVNEFQVGYAQWKELTGLVNQSDYAKITKAGLGLNIGQYYPSQNDLGLAPRITGLGSGSSQYSLLGNAPSIDFDNRFPMMDKTGTWEFSDGLTKIWKSHTFKVGFYYQAGRYLQAHTGSVFNGNFDFQPNTGNVNGDSQFALSNMLLGNYYSYTEYSQKVDYAPHWHVLDWYAQDSWKAKSNLSVDYGMRFSYDLPTNLADGYGVTFRPELYDKSSVTPLYQRVLYSKLTAQQQTDCRGAASSAPTACALNPVTMKAFPDAYTGKFISDFNFTGSSLNTDTRYPHSMRYSNGVLFAPRLGISWDPFKDGKTAVRFGLGVYYNVREGAGTMGDFSNVPPINLRGSSNYGNVSTFTANCNTTKNCNGTVGALSYGPDVTRILDPHRKIESNVPVQLSIQRNLGFSTVLDVAYVGTFTRHQSLVRNINMVSYGSQFEAKNLDPAQKAKTYVTPYGKVTQQPALSDNFFRSIPGYGEVNQRTYDGTSNYNALQTTLNRRFSKGLQFGVTYTWSKAMSYVDTVNGAAPTYADMRWYAYSESSTDRTHNLVIHWVANVPNASRFWNNRVVKAVGDNWEWSGLSQFVSGAPQSVTMDAQGLNLTGGGDASRVLLYGDPKVSFDRSSTQYLNLSNFGLPPVGTPSASTPFMTRNDTYRGPGINNWDMALQKNVPIAEKVKLTFRVEAYNVFNHVSFTSVDNKVVFDTKNANSTGLPISGGQVNGERGPRQLQLSGRITF